ncbi:MAG: Methyltransferase type 11 [Marmoricola sp.]|nr:Methyltransferase type 11 [Marmoricola sp.]
MPTQESGVLSVDRLGIHIQAATDHAVDVGFDGRRVWSFWTLRDTTAEPGSLLAEWPPPLRPFLDGSTRLTVTDHLSGMTLYDAEVALGSAGGRIAVDNARGNPLGIDKSGKLTQTFDTRGDDDVASLLDAMGIAFGALQDFGMDAFLAYGSLLGAVRSGRLIGHDSDADLGYVSRHEHPYDVIMESMALRRAVEATGLRTRRYSSSAFKVLVDEADGSIRGLDVFGGFLMGGDLHLMGELSVPFQRDWLLPLSTVTLEGRPFPAPAQPERLLEATYGANWRVPDPAYHYQTPRLTDRRLSGWFREGSSFERKWEARFAPVAHTVPSEGPSSLARLVVEREGIPARVVDLGWGRGGDALWFARQGSAVTGFDYAQRSSIGVRRTAEQEKLDVRSERLNFLDVRSWMSQASRLAHEQGPRTIFCRQVIEATTAFGRDGVWRFCDMVLRDGGRLYLEFHSGPRSRHGKDLLAVLPIDLVTKEIEDRGGRITEVSKGSQNDDDRPICQLVVEWQRPQSRPDDRSGGTDEQELNQVR